MIVTYGWSQFLVTNIVKIQSHCKQNQNDSINQVLSTPQFII